MGKGKSVDNGSANFLRDKKLSARLLDLVGKPKEITLPDGRKFRREDHVAKIADRKLDEARRLFDEFRKINGTQRSPADCLEAEKLVFLVATTMLEAGLLSSSKAILSARQLRSAIARGEQQSQEADEFWRDEARKLAAEYITANPKDTHERGRQEVYRGKVETGAIAPAPQEGDDREAGRRSCGKNCPIATAPPAGLWG